jgi:hypothetical protein
LSSRASRYVYFYYIFCFCSRVFIAPSAVYWNDFVAINASFADRAGAAVILDLKPSIETWPAIEMAA